jgi:hypothetical protein
MHPRSRGSKEWKIVLHFQGASRECFCLRENKGNFYAILYLNHEWLQIHVSYHASGQRHFKVGPKGREPEKRFVSICQSPSILQGVELVLGATILRGQFHGLRLYKASREQVILLDADAVHFRDDVIFVRVFLIEPNSEPHIPQALHSGPPLLHVITETRPWVGIAFFQQSDALVLHNGAVEVRGRVA